MSKSMQPAFTQCGFEWGPAKIERCASDPVKGWVCLLITTERYPGGVQVVISRSGKVSISSDKGYWEHKKE